MATPANPSTSALFKALMSKGADPQLAHAAVEEIRQLVGPARPAAPPADPPTAPLLPVPSTSSRLNNWSFRILPLVVWSLVVLQFIVIYLDWIKQPLQ